MDKKLITDFTNLANQQWQVINDGVMGGSPMVNFK